MHQKKQVGVFKQTTVPTFRVSDSRFCVSIKLSSDADDAGSRDQTLRTIVLAYQEHKKIIPLILSCPPL